MLCFLLCFVAQYSYQCMVLAKLLTLIELDDFIAFFQTKSNVCFKFLMCAACSSASFNVATSFSTSFEIKMVNHCGVHVKIQDIEHQLQENILLDFLHYNFL